MSVGIREPLSKLQFEPICLAPSNSGEVARQNMGYIYADANGESNIVICDYDQTCYFFGAKNLKRSAKQRIQDDYQSDDENAIDDSAVDDMNPMRTHYTHFKRYQAGPSHQAGPNQEDHYMTAQIVSVGPNHSIATESSTNIPFSWGDNSCGQLGLGDTKHRAQPGVIGSFSKFAESGETAQTALTMQMQKKEKERKIEAAAQADEEHEEEQQMIEAVEFEDKKYRFPIQIDLKKQH